MDHGGEGEEEEQEDGIGKMTRSLAALSGIAFRDVMQSYVHLNLLCCIMLMPNFLNFLSDFDHV